MYITPDLSADFTPEVPGKEGDLRLLREDGWLLNTEVRFWIQEKKSRWYLTMIFIAIDDPLKMICRSIDAYPSEKKALIYAQILQRGIRKDARGTLKMKEDVFHICDN